MISNKAVIITDKVAEWLRRLTRNQFSSEAQVRVLSLSTISLLPFFLFEQKRSGRDHTKFFYVLEFNTYFG